MAKIKNDPTKYVRRSDLVSPKVRDAKGEDSRVVRKQEQMFLTAPIDQGFYIDLSPSPSSRRRRD